MAKKTTGHVKETAARFESRVPASLKRRSTKKATRFSDWELSTAAKQISIGLPTSSLDDLQKILDLSNRQLSALLQISSRTLSRRRNEIRLPPDESERVFRLICLAELAVSVLHGEKNARNWLNASSYALGGQIPIDLAKTEPGATLVRGALISIEYGLTV